MSTNYEIRTRAFSLGGETKYKPGDVLPASAFTAGQLAASLRMGHIVPSDRPVKPKHAVAFEDSQSAESPAAVADEQPPVAEAVADEQPPVAPPADEPAEAAGDYLDESIDKLAVSERAREALKAHDLLTVGDAVDHYREHETFAGLDGIGKKINEELVEAVRTVEILLAEA